MDVINVCINVIIIVYNVKMVYVYNVINKKDGI